MKTLLLAAVLAAVSAPVLANQSRPQGAPSVPAARPAPVVVASASPVAGGAVAAAPAEPKKVRVVLPSPYRTE